MRDCWEDIGKNCNDADEVKDLFPINGPAGELWDLFIIAIQKLQGAFTPFVQTGALTRVPTPR